MKRLIHTLLFTLGTANTFIVMTEVIRAEEPISSFDQTHSAFTTLTAKYVKPAGVDYAGLKKANPALVSYLENLAAVTEPTFDAWAKDQQMAYLINLYNAATLKLVTDHYPVKSIKDIGAATGGPWKQKVVKLFGKVQSLDYLENDLLRPKYKDPRVHFAINCGSIGCPALRNEAFVAAKLTSQLDEQAGLFLKDTTKNKLDAGSKTLYLSQVFDWFKDDFVGKAGSVESFIIPYLSGGDAKLVKQGGFSIKFKDYDWSLNQQ
jgi:Protein of unknown function, DUF547